VPDRSHLRSASALSIALGLAAAPLGAQPADTPAGLLNTYPALSSIEDRSCLNILAEYEARAGSGALEPVIDGEIAPEAVENAEEDLLRCLRVASDAGETEAPVEDRDEPDAAEAAEAAPMAEEPVTPPEPEAEIAEPSPSAEAPAEPATGSAGTEAQAEAETEAESETDMPADAEPDTTESGPSEAAEGGQETVADTMPEPAEDEAGEIVEAEVQPEEDMLAEALAETAGTEAAEDAAAEDEAAPAETIAPAEDETPPAPEVVQEDTEALTEAANEPVTAAAAETEDTMEAEDVETTVVTVEDSRRSGEEFAATATPDDDGGIDLGQVAVGVIGGILLNELLGANEEVVANTGDRVVVQRGDGDYYVLKDENALLRQPGSEIETYRYADGSTRQVVTREDGSQVITVRAADGRPLRRVRVLPDGRRIVLFDDTDRIEPVDLEDLPPARAEFVEFSEDMDAGQLRRALEAEEADIADRRRFSLRQVRDLRAVRNLVPTLQLETINFETGSAAIRSSEAEELTAIGNAMRQMIDENPSEIFLIEGHTDAVGSAAFNLALSDRRAESVALALTEYFGVPPENMVVQGYGESNLRVPTSQAEPRNRRAAVRRITPLLNSASLQ